MDPNEPGPEVEASQPGAARLISPLSPGILGMGIPVAQPQHSTPLEDDDPGEAVPRPVLWALKYHRHLHFGHREDDQLRASLGDGNEAVYVIDDGPDRCMIGRIVGSSSDGCTYCLVGSADIGTYWRYAEGDDPLVEIFSNTKHLSLCAVYEADQGASNVIEVEHFSRVKDVPNEYLPPNPPIEFIEHE
jgi:hypothetical protein